jgi:iron complex transport system ATP-binding protein
MVFELDSVCFAYGERNAVEGLSFVIEGGRFHAVMGPNGCGKTTLLDLLSGYLKPGSGRILFDGKNLSGYGKRALAKRIALAPQNYRIDFPYTVEEVVSMGRYPHRSRFSQPSAQDREVVEKAIETCGVGHLSGRLVTELSGGEKQRVVFARAIAQESSVLLLDEPCSGMDIKHSLAMMKVASERVRQNGATVVAVLHDINLAARFADSLIFMKNGRLAESGLPAENLNAVIIKSIFDVDSVVSPEKNLNAPQVVFLQ